MRKHSIKSTTSHQNLKEFLNQELNKKLHYCPGSKARRDTTKPKRKRMGSSDIFDPSVENRSQNYHCQKKSTHKHTRKNSQKNSFSYLACNTSLEESTKTRPFVSNSFGRLRVGKSQLPLVITESDLEDKKG